MLKRKYLWASIYQLVASGAGMADATSKRNWPNGPFRTSGTTILDAVGETITYAGANWPAHGETMLPEGLQYQSAEAIVSKIKSLGMNSIRLTFAVEMVDQIIANEGKDITIESAFISALGEVNGTAVYNRVIEHNPTLVAATRLQAFDSIVAECAKQEIYVHLDNHVSKAMWCCDMSDGNSWFEDKHFPVAEWTRGLTFMADYGKKNWPNLMSMALRNELRPPLADLSLFWRHYNWENWYKWVKLGAHAVHSGNSDLLIFISGVDGDTTLRPIVHGTALTPGKETFSGDDFDGPNDKLVLEMHNYANIMGTKGKTDCAALALELHDAGFVTPSNAPQKFPLVLTEFGFDQNEWNSPFATCIERLVAQQGVGWMVWSLAGSYYVRQGQQDVDDEWGLLTHDWSDWRSPEHIVKGLKPMIQATLDPPQGSNHGWLPGIDLRHPRIPATRVRGSMLFFIPLCLALWLVVLCFLLRARGRSRRALQFLLASLFGGAVIIGFGFGSLYAFEIYLYMLVLSADRG